MPTESLQLLTPWAYNAYGFITLKPDGTQYGLKGFAHHPCAKWLYESPYNAAWLLWHAFAMCEEYSNRYGAKTHGALYGIDQVTNLFTDIYGAKLFWSCHTPFVLAMPEQYKNPENPVQSYRDYLLNEKGYAVWKHNNDPDWWNHETHRPARERYLAEREFKRIERANAKHQRVSGSIQG
jgi:hypothetical protein